MALIAKGFNIPILYYWLAADIQRIIGVNMTKVNVHQIPYKRFALRKNLIAIVDLHKYSFREIEKDLNLSPYFIDKVRQGAFRFPITGELQDLATWFGISFDDLVGLSLSEYEKERNAFLQNIKTMRAKIKADKKEKIKEAIRRNMLRTKGKAVKPLKQNIHYSLQHNLKHLITRLPASVTLDDATQQMGFPVGYISKFLLAGKPKYINTNDIYKILNYFNVTFNELTGVGENQYTKWIINNPALIKRYRPDIWF